MITDHRSRSNPMHEMSKRPSLHGVFVLGITCAVHKLRPSKPHVFMMRRGAARRGAAGQRGAWRGGARRGAAWCGAARRGVAWRGVGNNCTGLRAPLLRCRPCATPSPRAASVPKGGNHRATVPSVGLVSSDSEDAHFLVSACSKPPERRVIPRIFVRTTEREACGSSFLIRT